MYCTRPFPLERGRKVSETAGAIAFGQELRVKVIGVEQGKRVCRAPGGLCVAMLRPRGHSGDSSNIGDEATARVEKHDTMGDASRKQPVRESKHQLRSVSHNPPSR